MNVPLLPCQIRLQLSARCIFFNKTPRLSVPKKLILPRFGEFSGFLNLLRTLHTSFEGATAPYGAMGAAY